ncbi:MAG: hypothetical protein O4859_11900 [Trichodesmium sp. St18_bin1]|nr:hypothetical protein [Trichodesmium sp. St18_bin1]
MPEMRNVGYSAFQTDELHRHNQNLVGMLHATSLPWSTDMKTAVKVNFPKNSQCTNNE